MTVDVIHESTTLSQICVVALQKVYLSIYLFISIRHDPTFDIPLSIYLPTCRSTYLSSLSTYLPTYLHAAWSYEWSQMSGRRTPQCSRCTPALLNVCMYMRHWVVLYSWIVSIFLYRTMIVFTIVLYVCKCESYHHHHLYHINSHIL